MYFHLKLMKDVSSALQTAHQEQGVYCCSRRNFNFTLQVHKNELQSLAENTDQQSGEITDSNTDYEFMLLLSSKATQRHEGNFVLNRQ